jgi:hypothetical protein
VAHTSNVAFGVDAIHALSKVGTVSMTTRLLDVDALIAGVSCWRGCWLVALIIGRDARVRTLSF